MVARARARELRKQGKSIKRIAVAVEASVGSVSYWCKDIALSPSQRQALDTSQQAAARKALGPWILKQKERKRQDLQLQKTLGEDDLGQVSARDLFMLGLGLYWGEGYKRGSAEWGFTNSDPGIIRSVLSWLTAHYDVGVDRIIARVTINASHASQSERIIKEWSRETGIPLGQFGRASLISGYGKSRRDERTYRGTLRIKVRSGTSLRRRVLASISSAEAQIAPNSRKTTS